MLAAVGRRSSEADEADFNETGRRLASRVAEELKGRYAVYYFDHEARHTVAVRVGNRDGGAGRGG